MAIGAMNRAGKGTEMARKKTIEMRFFRTQFSKGRGRIRIGEIVKPDGKLYFSEAKSPLNAARAAVRSGEIRPRWQDGRIEFDAYDLAGNLIGSGSIDRCAFDNVVRCYSWAAGTVKP